MIRLAAIALLVAGVPTPPPARAVRPPWIERNAPERHLVELGPYWGAFLPSQRHELYEPDAALVDQGFREFRPAMADFGLRLGYFPLRFFGLEVEGGAMPGRTRDDTSATVFTFRGHVVGQVGLWRLTPFLLIGVSSIGVRSARSSVGDDTDIGAHFGGGVKLYINRWLAVRIDLRDVFTARQGHEAGITSNGEVLAGLSFTLGRKRPKATHVAAVDGDGDGLDDHIDRCPEAAAKTEDGCPILDSDEDGVADPKDACPREPAKTDDGCPLADRDGDKVPDVEDACPDVSGDGDDGCLRDEDGDGIARAVDHCPEERETLNGIDDEDGCPEALPEDLRPFVGVLPSVEFRGEALTRAAKVELDAVAAVLAKYPDINVRITVHTDARGKDEVNQALSLKQAEAVRAYLEQKGVAGERIDVVGAGSFEPLDPPAKSRRVELSVAEPRR